MSKARALTFRDVSLAESDAVDAAEWADASPRERLDAVEAIRRATIELYGLDVPQRLASVLVALDFPPRAVRDRRRVTRSRCTRGHG
jgi:hypothetical protein